MAKDVDTLDRLKRGDTAIVGRVGGEPGTVRRLMEMGLLPGTSVEMVRVAPMGDPIEFRLRGYLLSIRRAEAERIELEEQRPTDASAPVARGPAGKGKGTDKSASVVPRVLIAGNPNAGKTTMFNALTGARAQVGNYPGVTVTRMSRTISLPNESKVELVDLPGTYSLTSRSLEEEVAVDALLGRREASPDAVVVVVDASALERGLYLVQQVIETGVPVVVALNMVDEAKAAGVVIDTDKLADWLGATVVATVASKKTGLESLLSAVGDAMALGWSDDPPIDVPDSIRADVEVVEEAVANAKLGDTLAKRRFWAVWSLLSAIDVNADAEDVTTDLPEGVVLAVQNTRKRALNEGRDVDLEIIGARYRHIEAAASAARSSVASAATVKHTSRTDKIDGVLTHRVWGLLVFALIMAGLFEAMFTWANPLIELVEKGTAGLQDLVNGSLPAGVFRDLLTEGVIAGVGNVVVFVPQIALLFLFIAVLEDLGYLARVAFVIDRLMGRVGLHGKAFVPMLSGFACAIPAIMATRTIENKRDRLVTMLCLPLVSCSARLPVYVLITAVVFPQNQRVGGILTMGALVLFAMYSLSVIAAIGAAAVMKRTVLKGPRLPLVLELPPYRRPVVRNLLLTTWRRVRKFLIDAGTIILAMTIVLWAMLSFPKSDEIAQRYADARAQVVKTVPKAEQKDRLAELSAQENGEQIRNSIGGRVGRAIEPAIEPLGFDWRIGVGIIGAFAAREVFVSTLGIVFGIEEADEESKDLRSSLTGAKRADGSPLMTPLAGIALMVFFVLACQCMSTVVVVRTETGTWRWPLFMVGYMTVLAYVCTLAVYQGGKLMGWGL